MRPPSTEYCANNSASALDEVNLKQFLQASPHLEVRVQRKARCPLAGSPKELLTELDDAFMRQTIVWEVVRSEGPWCDVFVIECRKEEQ